MQKKRDKDKDIYRKTKEERGRDNKERDYFA